MLLNLRGVAHEGTVSDTIELKRMVRFARNPKSSGRMENMENAEASTFSIEHSV